MSEIKVREEAVVSPSLFIDTISKTFIEFAKKDNIINHPAIFVQGQPGIGKSQSINQIKKNLESSTNKKVNVKDIRLVLYSPIDISGVPVPDLDNKRAIWLVPEMFQLDDSNDVINILFLDELTAAPTGIQAAAYQIALDKKMGDHVLPKNTFVIAAGNRLEDNSISIEMPTALKNRFLHFELEISVNDWIKWAEENNINQEVIKVIRNNPEFLTTDNFDTESNIVVTPRSWELLSIMLNAVDGTIFENQTLVESIIGKSLTRLIISTSNDDILGDIFYGKIEEDFHLADLLKRLRMLEVTYKSYYNDKDKLKNVIDFIISVPRDYSLPIFKLLIKEPPKSFELEEIVDFDNLIKLYEEKEVE